VKPFDRSLYPFESRFFDRGAGVRMHYVDERPAGTEAGTVLFVHGNPSWSFYYRELVKTLRGTHRCVAVDHVGMGLSDKPDDVAYDYTLAQRVADLTAFIASLRIDGPLTLVLHDWGGMIGMAWAAANPTRVGKLVLLNTAAFPLPAEKMFPWPLALTRTPVGSLLVRGFNAFAWGATVFGMTRGSMSAAVQAGYLAPYASWGERIATLRFVQDIPLRPQDKGWEIVTGTAEKLPLFHETPTFIGWGGRDFVFDDAFLDEWKRRLPRAHVRYLADAGHYVLEDGAKELVPEVCAFVRR
jgi:pimeloyl-ACP methyl ester carboxylesterase